MDNNTKTGKSKVAIGVKMDTKIEAKASEQGADEALKSLYASVGSGLKTLLTCVGIALVLWAISTLK